MAIHHPDLPRDNTIPLLHTIVINKEIANAVTR